MKGFKGKFRQERGATAVEFAIILPVLILLIFGVIEFGRAYNSYLAVTHAAREGARLAAVGKFNAAVVESRAYPLTTAKGLQIIGPEPTDPGHGDPVTVTVIFPYELNIPLWGKQPINLKSVATMRYE